MFVVVCCCMMYVSSVYKSLYHCDCGVCVCMCVQVCMCVRMHAHMHVLVCFTNIEMCGNDHFITCFVFVHSDHQAVKTVIIYQSGDPPGLVCLATSLSLRNLDSRLELLNI